MGLKGIIFDLDGVLVDTVPLHFKAWRKMFAEYGKDFSFEEYKKKVNGIPRTDGVRAILPHLSSQELNEASSCKQNYFLEFLKKEGVKVYNSTVDFIKELKKQKIKVAVISSSKNCRHILERAGLLELFDVIITGNDIKKGKPDPEIFLLACKKLNLNPQECVVFEDAYLGVKAAKNAGIKCVGIDRYNNPERLQDADIVISDVSEISIEQLRRLIDEGDLC